MQEAFDLEISVLRTLLIGDQNAEALIKRLTREHFTFPEIAEVYSAMRSMYDRRGVVPDHKAVSFGPQFQELPGFQLILHPVEPIPTRTALNTKSQIKNALHEMEANIAIKGIEQQICPLLDKLCKELHEMSADDKLKLVDEFKKNAEAISTDGSSGLSKPEKLRSLLDRTFGKRISYEYAREKLEISPKELNKIASREEKRDEPRFRRERTPNDKHTGFLVLTQGLHMVRMMEKGNVREYRKDAAYLPDPLHQHIATFNQALGQHAFVMVAAWTDGLKSQFLMDCAAKNARMGRKVLFINHELDDVRAHAALASREVGYRVRDVAECNRIVSTAPWITRIEFMNIRQAVRLDELCEHIKKQDCDVVIWDYLATHFLLVDVQRQASAPATIVQTLGVKLVDAGIPLFAAVQAGMEENKFPLTWLHRATFSLVLRDLEREPDHIRACYKIYKNKEGGCGDYLDIFYDSDVLNIVQAKPLTTQQWNIRQENRRREMKEKAKEEYEAGCEEEPKANGRARKPKQNLKVAAAFGSDGPAASVPQAARRIGT